MLPKLTTLLPRAKPSSPPLHARAPQTLDSPAPTGKSPVYADPAMEAARQASIARLGNRHLLHRENQVRRTPSVSERERGLHQGWKDAAAYLEARGDTLGAARIRTRAAQIFGE